MSDISDSHQATAPFSLHRIYGGAVQKFLSASAGAMDHACPEVLGRAVELLSVQSTRFRQGRLTDKSPSVDVPQIFRLLQASQTATAVSACGNI